MMMSMREKTRLRRGIYTGDDGRGELAREADGAGLRVDHVVLLAAGALGEDEYLLAVLEAAHHAAHRADVAGAALDEYHAAALQEPAEYEGALELGLGDEVHIVPAPEGPGGYDRVEQVGVVRADDRRAVRDVLPADDAGWGI